jgi:hypothetical protein
MKTETLGLPFVESAVRIVSMTEPTPWDRITAHRASFVGRSDSEIVAGIRSLEPLPDADESDPVWDDANLQRVEFLIALAYEVGDRRLTAGIAPLYERAALGDVFDMMQGIRHGPERAVEPELSRLTAIMRPLAKHERAGCRRWAVRELGILRDPSAFGDLLVALDDAEEKVRAEACMSLVMMRQVISDEQRSYLRQRLEELERGDSAASVRAAAGRELARLSDS